MHNAGICNDLCSNSASFHDRLIREPQKPSEPVAKRDGYGIYVTLEWTQPEDDGGADITGYVIKYCDVRLDEEDTDVYDYATLSVAGNTTSFQFTDELEECMTYQFAVAAVNRDVQGEFSEFSHYVYTWLGK